MANEKKKSSYISGKESRNISRFNRRVTKKLEAQRADANKDPALYTTKMRDENNVVVVDGSGLIVNHTDRVVAIAGIKDIVVVDTPDALLVTTAANAQKVKQLVAEIKASKRPEVL